MSQMQIDDIMGSGKPLKTTSTVSCLPHLHTNKTTHITFTKTLYKITLKCTYLYIPRLHFPIQVYNGQQNTTLTLVPG